MFRTFPHRNQTEAAMAMLEAGADVNCPMDNEALTILLSAAWSGNFNIIKAIATSPGILLNVQVRECELCSVLCGYWLICVVTEF